MLQIETLSAGVPPMGMPPALLTRLEKHTSRGSIRQVPRRHSAEDAPVERLPVGREHRLDRPAIRVADHEIVGI